MRELLFVNAKTKEQISCVVTAHEIRSFRPLAIFCGCTVGFVVNIPEDRFSYDVAQKNLTVTDSTAAS